VSDEDGGFVTFQVPPPDANGPDPPPADPAVPSSPGARGRRVVIDCDSGGWEAAGGGGGARGRGQTSGTTAMVSRQLPPSPASGQGEPTPGAQEGALPGRQLLPSPGSEGSFSSRDARAAALTEDEVFSELQRFLAENPSRPSSRAGTDYPASPSDTGSPVRRRWRMSWFGFGREDPDAERAWGDAPAGAGAAGGMGLMRRASETAFELLSTYANAHCHHALQFPPPRSVSGAGGSPPLEAFEESGSDAELEDDGDDGPAGGMR
jgi:hypothetical protein